MPPAITDSLATGSLTFGDSILLTSAVLAFAASAALMGLLARRSRRRTDRRRHRSAAVATAAVAALVCTAYSADTSWRFAAQYLDMRNTTERTVMFAAAELALFATALMARQNLNGPRRAAGLPGSLVWVITAMQTIPAYAESGPVGGTVRAFTGPVMAAVLWHLAMGIELRQRTPDASSRGLAAVLTRQARERLLARMGIVEQDQGAAQISQQRAMRRAVALAARLSEMSPGQRTGRAGQRTVRRLSKALARSGVDADPRLDERLLRQLATRRQAASLATMDLAPRWTAPVQQTPSPHLPARHMRPQAVVDKRAEDQPRSRPADPGGAPARKHSTRPNSAADLGPNATARPHRQAPPVTGDEPTTGGQPGESTATPDKKARASEAVLRDYARRLHHTTGRLSRDSLEQAVRGDGYSVASDHAGDIVRTIKAELKATDTR